MDQESKTFLIEEYKTTWDYYNKTVEERKTLFDWYLKIVGVPAAVFGLTVKSGFKLDASAYSLIYALISAIGISLFITYVKQTSNSKGYLKSLNAIRQYFRGSEPELNKVLIMDQFHDMHYRLGKIVFWRSSIFILANSALFAVGIYYFLNSFESVQRSTALYTFLLMMITHFLIFILFSNSYQRKRKKELQLERYDNLHGVELKS